MIKDLLKRYVKINNKEIIYYYDKDYKLTSVDDDYLLIYIVDNDDDIVDNIYKLNLYGKRKFLLLFNRKNGIIDIDYYYDDLNDFIDILYFMIRRYIKITDIRGYTLGYNFTMDKEDMLKIINNLEKKIEADIRIEKLKLKYYINN